MTEETKIANRYSKFGVTEADVYCLIQFDLDCGVSRDLALIETRVALSHRYGVAEYFTKEEAAFINGSVTVEDMLIDLATIHVYPVIIRPAPGFESLFV